VQQIIFSLFHYFTITQPLIAFHLSAAHFQFHPASDMKNVAFEM